MTSIYLVLNPSTFLGSQTPQPFNLPGFETSIHVCETCSIEGTHTTNTPPWMDNGMVRLIPRLLPMHIRELGTRLGLSS